MGVSRMRSRDRQLFRSPIDRFKCIMSGKLDDQLAGLTERLLASYASDKETHRIGESFLPSRSRIISIIEVLRQLLFPGFFGTKKLDEGMLELHIVRLLADIDADLSEEIYHCYCATRHCENGCDTQSCRDQASEAAMGFLQQLTEIRRLLSLDVTAAFDGDPAARSKSEIIYCYPGFYAIMVYRIAHALHVLEVPLMPRIMSEYAHQVTGMDIHPGAEIGERFFVDHSTGVVIGETTTIGNDVKIYQGVTLGALSFPKDDRGRVIKGIKRHPSIEDGVTIYANATILGGDTVIGSKVTVAGNAFVTESVTADSLVVSERPRLKVRERKVDGE